ncbi:uncharacterized protein LOC108027809 [Drosophila biarmipes]|uniref:uncharacterized protein LOC108027809 n=1 Tax=Drosophila biarmipes TaxID=125945 RepID=UPI0007E7E8FA|nr:uncharacterized protein LOC108027809 [Drosophila biarmipes]
MAALSFLLSVTLLWILFQACQSAAWEGIRYDPKYPGKCTIHQGLVLNPGVSIKDPTHECRQIVCGHSGQVAFHSCGVTVLSDSCRHGAYINPEKPYPECCRRALICN